MTALNAMQRHQRILEALELDGKVSVMTLSDSLRVSVVTIRNDLEQLERQQVLRRIRGGALASGRRGSSGRCIWQARPSPRRSGGSPSLRPPSCATARRS